MGVPRTPCVVACKSGEFHTLEFEGMMRARKKKTLGYAICMRNTGFAASLEVRKLYPVLVDVQADANGLIRVIDESGEDYLYPADLFQRVTLPAEIQRALQLAS